MICITSYLITYIFILNMNIAKTILSTLRSTALQHKKKLIGVVIVMVGGYIARKKVKLHHLISLFLFCMRLFSKVLGYLPLPSFAPYRTTLPFKYYPHYSHPHLETIVSIEPIRKRIKVLCVIDVESLTWQCGGIENIGVGGSYFELYFV
jgi:hypothetical protein